MRGLFLWLLPVLAAQATDWLPPRTLTTSPAVTRGGAIDGDTLLTWGEEVRAYALPIGTSRRVGRLRHLHGGCLLDVDEDGRAELIVQEGEALGRLLWLDTRRGQPSVIDQEIEFRDCLAATLFGRRGVLLIHRYNQLRFYEVPPNPRGRWPYQEVYSFYTPSEQGGLALADIDGDGRTDILCGNYWVRSPEAFGLPWRLFAINTYTELTASARLRLMPAHLTGAARAELVVSQAALPEARLTWFSPPSDPRQMWDEHRVTADPPLGFLRGLLVLDADRDARPDILAGEDRGTASRLLLFRNAGRGQFAPQVVAEGSPVVSLLPWRDAVVVLGPRRIQVWQPAQRRR